MCRYVQLNIQYMDSYRQYNPELPAFLRNWPRDFVRKHPSGQRHTAERPAIPSHQHRHRQRVQCVVWWAGQHASMWMLWLGPVSLALQAHAGNITVWRKDVEWPVFRVSGQSVLHTGRWPLRRGIIADARNQRRHWSLQRRGTVSRHWTLWWWWRTTVRWRPVTLLCSSTLPGTPSLASGRHLHVHWPGYDVRVGADVGAWWQQHTARSTANVQYTFNDYEPKATDDSLRDVVNDIKLIRCKDNTQHDCMELIWGVIFSNWLTKCHWFVKPYRLWTI